MLPLLLTGCLHKGHQQQVQATAPLVDAAPVQPPSVVKNPPKEATAPNPPTPSTTASKPSQKPKPAIKHPQPAKSNTAKTPAASSSDPRPATSAGNGVSAIGQLTSDDSVELGKQTGDAIASIEQNLNRIDRKFDEQEQKTAAQLREYLKRAKAALSSGDVDGAHTLTAKAKLLLNELNP
jgi:outer membrane biosynthesis protein TonB